MPFRGDNTCASTKCLTQCVQLNRVIIFPAFYVVTTRAPSQSVWRYVFHPTKVNIVLCLLRGDYTPPQGVWRYVFHSSELIIFYAFYVVTTRAPPHSVCRNVFNSTQVNIVYAFYVVPTRARVWHPWIRCLSLFSRFHGVIFLNWSRPPGKW